MQPFTRHIGIVAPLHRANIDTDAIIPKQFLKRISRTGFGQFLFYDWRFDETGAPNPEFILNRSPYEQATILIGGPNFGCGSSREHAPWALQDYGFQAIIAASFADIFYNNCFKNGLLPIVLPLSVTQQLAQLASESPGFELQIDLVAQEVRTTQGDVYSFEVDSYRKMCMLRGLDDIALTLRHADAISAYEANAPFAIAIPPTL
ncbi:3-isopropylmalate dehydratase small subunit [Sulfoacidibacillus thermotolerans]|uniref:3-isopropylmalate dehydratase small subunit n=1 Tax=Sulfoacidibacillus thermotolerans TaxID=1765684 RepID=A0A2U3D926_SULT2|nr:3-isopropylmalate dehydratase small subunit [Sulfoacidibacillus thermotolerans]PWI57765.1 3-isopropylmalate dehydratase small subunit [Sulfoacidibacillus thermotolerans]